MSDNSNSIRRRRAMTSDGARTVRAAGHAAEEEFTSLIGGTIYSSARKKDVIDKRGDIHSVKSGKKKWQIFLYSEWRLRQDIDFQGAKLLIRCINSFPEARVDYLADKIRFKRRLQPTMRKLKDFLSNANNKIVFFKKAFLNNGEVDYFTPKDGNIFRIFDGNEVIEVISNSTYVVNSEARREGEMDDQKVVFKLNNDDTTIGEIEMRNDSDIHYREVKFWMDREKTLNLLKSKIRSERQKYHRVIAHGKAISKFRVL